MLGLCYNCIVIYVVVFFLGVFFWILFNNLSIFSYSWVSLTLFCIKMADSTWRKIYIKVSTIFLLAGEHFSPENSLSVLNVGVTILACRTLINSHNNKLFFLWLINFALVFLSRLLRESYARAYCFKIRISKVMNWRKQIFTFKNSDEKTPTAL